MSSPTFFPEVERMNIRQKDQKSAKFMKFFLVEEVEIFEYHGCPIVQDLVDEEMWICLCYPFRHKNTRQKCLVTE